MGTLAPKFWQTTVENLLFEGSDLLSFKAVDVLHTWRDSQITLHCLRVHIPGTKRKQVPEFPPKVVLDFHLNQMMCLPVFFPKPHSNQGVSRLHTLHICMSSAICFQRTTAFRAFPKSFIALAERMKRSTDFRPVYGFQGVLSFVMS